MSTFATLWPWIEESGISLLQLARLAAIPHGRLYYSPHLLTREQVQAIAWVLDERRRFPSEKGREEKVAENRRNARLRRAMVERGISPDTQKEADGIARLEAEADELEALLRPLSEQWAEVGVPERVYAPQVRTKAAAGPRWECKACEHRWRGRKATDPVKCPRCQSRSWNVA